MRVPTPIPGELGSFAPVPLGFHDAASSLATAAESLSKAAHAMATAAQAMSNASRAFTALNTPIPDAVMVKNEGSDRNGESADEPLERESEDDLIEISSDSCPSETSSSDVGLYDSDEDDFGISTKAPAVYPVTAPHDPTVAAPCPCGPMDISRIRLNPYPPRPLPKTTLGTSSSSSLVRDSSDLPDAPSTTDDKECGGTSDFAKMESQKGLSDVKSPRTALVSSSPKAESAKQNVPITLATPPKKHISVDDFSTPKLNTPTSPVYPMHPLGLRQSVIAHPKLPWGRNYIQLEEDFDAIPIISCMALASNKTICLVPSSGSLEAYKKIFNAITKLGIEDQGIEAFLTATSSSILLLPFESIPHILLQTASVDCVIHWGWPESLQNYLKLITLMKLRTRSCLILPTGDHLKPRKDSKASDNAVVKYSDTVLSSYFGPKAPIHEIRRKAIEVLTETDAETMKILYHSWLNYYGAGPARRADWTISNLIDYARRYAAKTLLKGSPNDGSKLYPPTSGKRLPLPDWVIEEAASLQPNPLQPSPAQMLNPAAGGEAPCSPVRSLEQTRILAVPTSAFANIEAKLTCYPTTGRLISSLAPPVSPTQPCVSPSPKQLVLPTISKAAPLSPPSKQPSPTPETVLSQTLPEQLTGDQSESVHYYFVLEEEFDAIPLISYLGLNHERTICYVPSPESMKLYQSIFQTITKLTVVSPTAMGDANQTQARLASASKPTMLVQFYWALHSSALQRSGADASICWGVPTDVESYMNGAAKSVAHSYLILSTKEYNDPVVRTSLSRFGISKHPSNDSFNDCSDNSPLAPMRQKTMAHFKPAEFSATAATLYYCFISYYSLGRGRPKGMTPENVVRAANTYAAKSLLRGKPEDGSKRYPPVASRPSLASKAAKAFKLDGAKRMGLLN